MVDSWSLPAADLALAVQLTNTSCWSFLQGLAFRNTIETAVKSVEARSVTKSVSIGKFAGVGNDYLNQCCGSRPFLYTDPDPIFKFDMLLHIRLQILLYEILKLSYVLPVAVYMYHWFGAGVIFSYHDLRSYL
jgi:hypothetical protein